MSNQQGPGHEYKTSNWGGEFSTNRQKVEGITTEQSLDIISKASREGIATQGGNKIVVPESTTMDGQTISLRIKEAKAAEDAQKANPNAKPNPFGATRNAPKNNEWKGKAPPQIDLTK